MTKKTLDTTLRVNDFLAVIDLEMRSQMICGKGPNVGEATRAFLEKGPPRYADAPRLR